MQCCLQALVFKVKFSLFFRKTISAAWNCSNQRIECLEQNHFQPFKAWWLVCAYVGRLNTKILRHVRTLHLGIFCHFDNESPLFSSTASAGWFKQTSETDRVCKVRTE
jgi:hypothetical protein